MDPVRSHAGAGRRLRSIVRGSAWPTFAALAVYGVVRWSTLLRPAPGWRLVGLLALAIVLAGGVPLLARRDRVLAGGPVPAG